MAYVSPERLAVVALVGQGKRHSLQSIDLIGEVLLITGSPRLVQSLIAGDVDVAFAGITAITRARVRGAEIAILGAAANVSSQKLVVGRNSKIRRLEDLKGAIIGVSQYGSGSGHLHTQCAGTRRAETGQGRDDSSARRSSAGRRGDGRGQTRRRCAGGSRRTDCGESGRKASRQRGGA